MDGETLESYYARFYKMINELVRNQCDVTNHQVNVQFLLQLQPEWQRFMTLIKQGQELKTVSYHKLYDILKQHLNEVNEIRAERLTHTANPLARVAQQQPVYHPQNHPTHYTQNSSTRSQQVATRKREIYKPTNNNLKTSSNTSKANQDNTLRINRGTGYDIQRAINVVGARENVGTQVVHQSGIQCYNCKEFGHVARECQKPKWAKDAAYHKEKMLLFKFKRLHQMLLRIMDPSLMLSRYKSDNNITTDSLDMSNNGKEADQDDDDNLVKERDLLASLIEKLKCKIYDSKNRNKILESSNKTLIDKLKGEIKDFKNKNKSLESSNNHFKEANTKLAKNNQLMFKDLKMFQAELDRYHDVNYASKVEIECAKAKRELVSHKMSSEKSFNKYTQKINDLNQTISEMKKELIAHQVSISIMS
ncbi:retrovirus-related pol polyprotein from transposon TNT 1-94 [Tanacetum coccineum]